MADSALSLRGSFARASCSGGAEQTMYRRTPLQRGPVPVSARLTRREDGFVRARRQIVPSRDVTRARLRVSCARDCSTAFRLAPQTSGSAGVIWRAAFELPEEAYDVE